MLVRIVGDKNRDEFVLDPVAALRRGAKLDAQMKVLLPAHPRGVWRGIHAFFNRMDDERAAAMAKRVAESPCAYPTPCTEIVTLGIDGLLKTKTDYRDKDKNDRLALEAIKRRL